METKDIDKEKIDKMIDDCKFLKRKLIKNIIINLIVVLLETYCIYSLFIIKQNGFQVFPKEICLIILSIATIIGLNALIELLKTVKNYLYIFVIKSMLNKFKQ